MNIDSIAPIATTTGSGAIIGFLVGYAIKKVIRIILVKLDCLLLHWHT